MRTDASSHAPAEKRHWSEELLCSPTGNICRPPFLFVYFFYPPSFVPLSFREEWLQNLPLLFFFFLLCFTAGSVNWRLGEVVVLSACLFFLLPLFLRGANSLRAVVLLYFSFPLVAWVPRRTPARLPCLLPRIASSSGHPECSSFNRRVRQDCSSLSGFLLHWDDGKPNKRSHSHKREVVLTKFVLTGVHCICTPSPIISCRTHQLFFLYSWRDCLCIFFYI